MGGSVGSNLKDVRDGTNGPTEPPAEAVGVDVSSSNGLGGRSRSETVRSRLSAAFPDQEPGETYRLSQCLSNNESILKNYFEELTPSKRTSTLRVTIFWREVRNAVKRRKIAEAFSFFAPEFEYGPYCTGVRIGSVFLTWGANEVLIPQPNPNPTFVEASEGGATGTTSDGAAAAVAGPHARDALRSDGSFSEEITVSMDGRSGEGKVEALIGTIVKYNSKYHYGLLTCNCQHFINDVLESLQAKEHINSYKNSIACHEAVLLKRGNVLKDEFNTHTELDNYVRVRLEDLKMEELQFCSAHYILFHVWQHEWPQEEAWQCHTQTCLFGEIRRRL